MSAMYQSRFTSANQKLMRWWTVIVILFLYMPMLAVVLASFSKIKFFMFPVKIWSTKWYESVFNSLSIREYVFTSLSIAAVVTVISVVMAIFGALAFARYDWKGRSIYQKMILLPIFFPQAVLGLAILLWTSSLGITPTWHTAIFAHLVWIVPIVTLVIAIQVYGFDPSVEEAAYDLGASRVQVFKEVTLPILWPGIFSGALFAFLLSWGNFPLSTYTTGADQTAPEWLYAKMVAGYTPQVPALGSLTVLMAAIILFGSYWLGMHFKKKKQRAKT
ncbi:MAG: ABC transporter permease [Hydrogenovibrio sp.]|jgi:spermidine/putrescine transport system permease protein